MLRFMESLRLLAILDYKNHSGVVHNMHRIRFSFLIRVASYMVPPYATPVFRVYVTTPCLEGKSESNTKKSRPRNGLYTDHRPNGVEWVAIGMAESGGSRRRE